METIVSSINVGFTNCVFLNRNPKTIESIITEKINNPEVEFLSKKPNSIKVETIDAFHDKLSLSYDEEDIEGTITWRQSQNGKHYVFNRFEC